MNPKLRFLLLQIRNSDDPMRHHEVECFARVLRCNAERIQVYDLLCGVPDEALLDRHDMVLLGGSGHYSAAGEGDWLQRALQTLQILHAHAKPTFASCWGFQAMARALGGTVINDLSRAELGTNLLMLTSAGLADPVFAPLGETFLGQMGHEDVVTALPPDVTRLASSDRVQNQAYRCNGLPIYCTQFHPELSRRDIYIRLENYPEYIKKISGIPLEAFKQTLHETTETEGILTRFVETVFGK